MPSAVCAPRITEENTHPYSMSKLCEVVTTANERDERRGYSESIQLAEVEKRVIQYSLAFSETTSNDNMAVRWYKAMCNIDSTLYAALASGLGAGDKKWQYIRALLGILTELDEGIQSGKYKKLTDCCQQVGVYHTKMRNHGFAVRHFSVIRNSLVKVVEKFMENQKWLRESVRTWAKISNFIVYHMKTGYRKYLRTARQLEPSPSGTKSLNDNSKLDSPPIQDSKLSLTRSSKSRTSNNNQRQSPSPSPKKKR